MNMLLAEDRLLTLALFTKPRKKYVLRYIPNAVAYTDAVMNIFEWINQRRRWINGSW
jgi:chitin synthase